ncbi:MAG: extracellular solute-binding protein [Sulfolobaceae archaeon]|nr:extracellular solute-binding protein [Sulfolobaceae archaeon]
MNIKKAISTTLIIAIVVIVIIAAIAGVLLVTMRHPSVTTTTTSVTSSTTTSVVTNTSAPITLTVVTFSGTSANWIQYMGNIFSQEHPGVKVEVITFPFSEYLSKELSVLEAHSSAYDLIGYTSTSAMLVGPYLMPLNMSNFNMSDLITAQVDFGGYYYNLTTGKYYLIGLPYETAIYLMAYNATIFDNQTLAQEFEAEYHMNFSPLTYQNWTAVLDVDQFLTSHHITQYGFLIDDHVAHGIIDAFPAVYGWFYYRNSTVNMGNPSGIPGFYIMFEGQKMPGYTFPLPSFNSSAGVEALITYKELVSYEPSPSQVQISYDNLPEFFSKAPGAFLFTSQISYINGTVLLAPLPGGYAETGTDFLGISQYSVHKQLAMEFLKFLLSPQAQEILFYKFHKFPISKEAFTEIISNTSLPYYLHEQVTEVYRAAQNATANPPNIPPTYEYLIPSFNNLVFQFLTSQSTNSTYAMQILQQAASEWIKDIQSSI